MLRLIGSLGLLIILIYSVEHTTFSFFQLLKQCQVLLYVWPVVVQFAVLLFAQQMESKRWSVCLASQGISLCSICCVICLNTTVYAVVYSAFLWVGFGGEISGNWVAFSLNPCEFIPMQCSIPELWDGDLTREIIARIGRVFLSITLPIFYFVAFCTHRMRQWTLYVLIIIGFLLQEIAFAWFPLSV